LREKPSKTGDGQKWVTLLYVTSFIKRIVNKIIDKLCDFQLS